VAGRFFVTTRECFVTGRFCEPFDLDFTRIVCLAETMLRSGCSEY